MNAQGIIDGVVAWGTSAIPFAALGICVVFVILYAIGRVRSIMAGDGHFGIIEAYVGFVRHGKTMLAVQDCVALARQRGAILASNIAIFAPGVRVKLLSITDDGLDLDELYVLALQCRELGVGLVLLIDEAGIVMPSRQWQNFPVGLMWLLQQSGKLAVEIRYTTQHPMFVDVILRSLTAVLHNVRGTPPPSIMRRIKCKEADGDNRRLIGRVRRWFYRPWWFWVTTTVPSDFDKADPDRVLWRRKVKYQREWEGSYDTDAAVLPAGRLKGAADFLAQLDRARETFMGPEDEEPLSLDARLDALIAGLPHVERERTLEALRTAGKARGG